MSFKKRAERKGQGGDCGRKNSPDSMVTYPRLLGLSPWAKYRMKRQHKYREIHNNYEKFPRRSEIAMDCVVSLYEGMYGMGRYEGFKIQPGQKTVRLQLVGELCKFCFSLRPPPPPPTHRVLWNKFCPMLLSGIPGLSEHCESRTQTL